MSDDFDRRIELLVQQATRIYSAERDNDDYKKIITMERLQLDKLIANLDASLKILNTHEMEFLIEDVYSLKNDGDVYAYKMLCSKIAHMIESARELKNKKYPKRSLNYAAMGFLLATFLSNKNMPKMYDHGDDVKAFRILCEKIGIRLSNESYRAALTRALKSFDRYMYMAEYEYMY